MAYNGQAMVSPVTADGKVAGMLITAADVVSETTDQSQLGPMMEQAEETTGFRAETTLADAGYHSGSNLEECARRGQQVVMPESQDRALGSPYHKDRFVYDEASDRYRCPEGQWLRFTGTKLSHETRVRYYRSSGAVCQACPAFGVCTKNKRHGRGLEIGPHDAVLRAHRVWDVHRRSQNGRLVRESNWSNRSSGSSRNNSTPRSSCHAAYPTWRLSGPCWLQHSTCAPCGGCSPPNPRGIEVGPSPRAYIRP